MTVKKFGETFKDSLSTLISRLCIWKLCLRFPNSNRRSLIFNHKICKCKKSSGILIIIWVSKLKSRNLFCLNNMLTKHLLLKTKSNNKTRWYSIYKIVCRSNSNRFKKSSKTLLNRWGRKSKKIWALHCPNCVVLNLIKTIWDKFRLILKAFLLERLTKMSSRVHLVLNQILKKHKCLKTASNKCTNTWNNFHRS